MMDHLFLNEPFERDLFAEGSSRPPCGSDRRMAQLEEHNRELDAFARDAAHELRNSIAQMITIAERLINRRSDEDPQQQQQQQRWQQLQLQIALNMDSTLGSMLDLARSSSDALCMEEVDVTALCHALLRELDGDDRCAAVQWRIGDRMKAFANPTALALALRNLLSNAVKYTRNVEHPVVSVQARTIGSWYQITVADNGPGFDGAMATRVFEPFVRLHTDEHCRGVGLGLSIVKRVIERHGGFVRAFGIPRYGARFEINLRVRARDAATSQ